jgi:hypothetical protein
MVLSGAAFAPIWRGWHFWPARAHPFWTIRGKCPLQADLIEREKDEK